MQTLILGIDNELLGDEGGGVRAARLLHEESLPKQTKIVSVGTATPAPPQIWDRQI